MHFNLAPPDPSELRHLKATNAAGCVFLSGTMASTLAGIGLSGVGAPGWWLAGQVLLAAALVHWFILLHECGHGTLFKTAWANHAAGHIAGVFSLIPFECWKRVHN